MGVVHSTCWGLLGKAVDMAGVQAAARRYPVGIQTFSEVRESGYLYVDKTRYIYDLAHDSGKAYFLSRPRRFGKSLLLSTMQAYFEGRRELFEGLVIAELETEWESHPVIRLDLSTVKTESVEELPRLLDYVLAGQEAVWGRDPQAQTPGSCLMGLIRTSCRQAGSQVVVLIDEYDAPLLNVAHDPELLHKFRVTMRELFAPLKACDEYLRFVFLTGITKFSQLSIFSELNNLTNLSMMPELAGVCGITQDELEKQMAPDVEAFADRLGVTPAEALAQLKANYDGYHFCEGSPDIYNPFSLLSALRWGQIDSYWFGSGTPTVLVNLLRENSWEVGDFEGVEAFASEFDVPTEAMQTPLPMLYQSGYLTIKSYDRLARAYTLGVPNAEVAQGLSGVLASHAAGPAVGGFNGFLRTFGRAVRAGDIESALTSMRSFMAGIPYHLGSRSERGFQTTFWIVFTLLGAQIETEVKTATGRADAVMRLPEAVYVFEFKYDRSAAEALAQIDDRGYLVPFEADGRKLFKVGVNFSGETQTIEEWLIEEA